MKVLVAVVALAMLATTAPSVADDNGRACSTASLKGRYGLAQHGVRLGIYDSMGIVQFLATPVRVDGILDEAFDGHGNATETEKVFANGSAAPSGVNPTTSDGSSRAGSANIKLATIARVWKTSHTRTDQCFTELLCCRTVEKPSTF